jgi:PAS domain S-box-containing protein
VSDTTDIPFRDLAEFAPDALLAVKSDGVIAYANHYAHTVFGYAPDTLQGRSVEELIPSESRNAHIAHRRAFAAQPQFREMGSRLVPLFGLRRDGTQFRAEVRLSPIQTKQGMLMAAAIRDATEQDRVMAQLTAARETAEKANEAKTRFVAAVSHDLRQPLQTLNAINAILQRQPTDANSQTLLQQEKQSLDAIADLLNALLNLSKLESGTVAPNVVDVSLFLLLQELRLQFADPAAAKGLRIEFDAGDGGFVRTDRALFHDLLQNLIGNSIRYTDVGSVRVRCNRAPGDQVAIEVIDTGIGIAPTALPKIWDDFYQVPGPDGAVRRGGTGLGLAIVKRLANILHIEIKVDSVVGRGTRMTVTVPNMESPKTPQNAARAKPSAPVVGAGRKIIFVEDDAAVRGAITMYLKMDGYSVHGAGCLQEVDALLESFDGAPAIVISDFSLQRNEFGTDAIERIRNKFGRSLPAIVLTGDVSTVPMELLEGTNTRLMDKPIDVTQLTATIGELLNA